MNLNNLTIKSQEAIQRAQQLALENGNQQIEPGHVLKGIMEVDENVTPFVLQHCRQILHTDDRRQQ